MFFAVAGLSATNGLSVVARDLLGRANIHSTRTQACQRSPLLIPNVPPSWKLATIEIFCFLCERFLFLHVLDEGETSGRTNPFKILQLLIAKRKGSYMKCYTIWKVVFRSVVCLFLSTLVISCEDELMDSVTVYSNDFSKSEQNSAVTNAKWHLFNGDTLLGWYHNEEIGLNFLNLPKHNTVEVTIELLVHDSWDGNPDDVGGPDYWYLHMDGEEIINTTFNNSPCGSNYCIYQSYPENYPRTFEPKTGALETNLPGRCQYRNVPGWTTKYRITRRVKHNSDKLEIQMGDRLKQENAYDPTCDESWSISKIEVNTLTVK